MRTRGSVGAIVDGFTGDGRKVLAMGFPVFARGMPPIDTTGRFRGVDYDVPVKLGQLTVESGKIIFADPDGILVIPREIQDEVLDKALERTKVETKVRSELQSGYRLGKVWKKYDVP